MTGYRTAARGMLLCAALLTVPLVLGGCAAQTAEPAGGPAAAAPAPDDSTPAEPAPDDADGTADGGEDAELRQQAESCEWDAAVLRSDIPSDVSSAGGDLQADIIGSWQHTHYDSGSGYTALDDEDIRYVFPSADRLLYCQHVPGQTEYAENAAAIEWDENRIVLPGAAPGFVVESWNAEAMVWVNLMDDSRYLLQRR